MKGYGNSGDNKKPRTACPSKKSSNANSLVYQEIAPFSFQQKAKLNCSKNREQDRPLTTATSSKKNSINQLQKKNSKAEMNVYQKKQLINFSGNYGVNPGEFQDPEYLMCGREDKTMDRTENSTSSKKTKLKFDLYNQCGYKIEKKLFSYQYIIGKGGFGKVWKVEHVKTRNQYAIKEMLKSIVMTKKSVQSVMNQRVLLQQLSSPFIVNMHFAFQDRDTLFLVLDLMEGGDLRYHIGNKIFNQLQSKFFIACIVLGLEDLQNKKIIHRDIKPENLVLDCRGYIRITDLGIARIQRANNSCDTSGTLGYMSPQVICRLNHSFVSDYFALGIIAYELMTGKRPYNGKSRAQIRDNMLAKQIQLRNSEIPPDWSYEAADFINRLIQRKPEQRLGFNDISEIKSHPWLDGIKWEKLRSKEIESPFIPMMKKTNFDQDEQITIEDEEEANLIEKNAFLLRKPQFQELFLGYFFDKQERVETEKPEQKSVSTTPNGHNKRTISVTRKSQNEKDLKLCEKFGKNSTETVGAKKTIEHDCQPIPRIKDKIAQKHLDTMEIKERRKNSGSFIEKSFFKEFKH